MRKFFGYIDLKIKTGSFLKYFLFYCFLCVFLSFVFEETAKIMSNDKLADVAGMLIPLSGALWLPALLFHNIVLAVLILLILMLICDIPLIVKKRKETVKIIITPIRYAAFTYIITTFIVMAFLFFDLIFDVNLLL